MKKFEIVPLGKVRKILKIMISLNKITFSDGEVIREYIGGKNILTSKN